MRGIEEIVNQVCWNHGYISFQQLQDNLKYPTTTGHKELFSIIQESAKMYAREAERYYSVNEDLVDEVAYLQYRVKELEDELNKYRED